MKEKNKKILYWILLLGWMAFIFFMSNQPGDISSEQSQFVLQLFKFFGIKLDSYFGELATLIIRKVAHFSEYFILFILLNNVLKFYTDNNRAKVYAIIMVFLYACSDEFHQSFIPGRSAAFRDVVIDTSGGIFACIVITTYIKIKAYLYKKRA